MNFEIITVSNHSKASFYSLLPESKKAKINVFYSPMVEYDFENKILPNSIENKKYFLLNSSARWQKNNLRAVMALDSMFSEGDLDFNVVLTGVQNESIFLKKIKNKDKFILLGFVENNLMENLFANAYAFVYPSLNEGFGYPPIQAMRYGVPSAVSGSQSMPEICGNATLYFNPHLVYEIKNRIIQLLDKEIYDDLEEKCKKRYEYISERQRLDLEKMTDFILENKE